MIVGACLIQIDIPYSRSLKDKRRHLKSLLARLKHEFNVAVAECDHHDLWKSAEIAIVSVNNARAPVEAQLRHAVKWIEQNYPDLDVANVELEWR